VKFINIPAQNVTYWNTSGGKTVLYMMHNTK